MFHTGYCCQVVVEDHHHVCAEVDHHHELHEEVVDPVHHDHNKRHIHFPGQTGEPHVVDHVLPHPHVDVPHEEDHHVDETQDIHFVCTALQIFIRHAPSKLFV